MNLPKKELAQDITRSGRLSGFSARPQRVETGGRVAPGFRPVFSPPPGRAVPQGRLCHQKMATPAGSPRVWVFTREHRNFPISHTPEK
jgi:hypothetical protein